MEIGIIKIADKVDEQVFAELLTCIDPAKRDRIKGFLRWQDRQRSVFAELLLRLMLTKTAGLLAADICFTALPSGKPVLPSHEGIHFNISHAGDWMACVIDDNNVGIDVEQVIDTDLSLSDRFFSRAEHEDIISSADPGQRFFDYWTLKESYIKFTGNGLSQPLNSFAIRFLESALIGVEANGVLLPNVHFKQYEMKRGYKMAVCASGELFPEAYAEYTLEDIMSGMIA